MASVAARRRRGVTLLILLLTAFAGVSLAKGRGDDVDGIVSQALIGPGLAPQVRRREYDDANRLIATVDAENGRRTLGVDAKGNVTSRSDARGYITHYEYDARDRLTAEIGPAPGQTTRYAYDLAGNKTGETWANGNTRGRVQAAVDQREERSRVGGDLRIDQGDLRAFWGNATAGDRSDLARSANDR